MTAIWEHIRSFLRGFTFSRGFKDILLKTAKFKEFPGLENKFSNSRGFKEIKDSYEPCFICGKRRKAVRINFFIIELSNHVL